jgi:hypothetical protein
MPELGPYGSVRGAAGNSRPYRECRPRTAMPRVLAAGVRKPPGEETAVWGCWGCGSRYGDLTAGRGDLARGRRG